MNKILITPRSLSRDIHPELKRLQTAGYELVMPSPGQLPDEAALLATVEGCVGWLAGVEPISPIVIKKATALKVISRNGTGIDNLPLDALQKQKIAVYKAEGTNAQGVAELALAHQLAAMRSLFWTHEGIRKNEWPRKIGKEIRDVTVGVIGLGAIGRTFANLNLAIGARVFGYDPFANSNSITGERFKRCELDEIIRECDVISLHCPMPHDGKPLLDATTLPQTKQGFILINTARAGLIDEAEILKSIETGQVSVYATDVFETEPPKAGSLLTHPNVQLSSHIGGFTDASVWRSTQKAVDNLLEGLGAN